MKIVTIIEGDKITGIKYGVKEIPDTETYYNNKQQHTAYARATKLYTANTNRIRATKQKHK